MYAGRIGNCGKGVTRKDEILLEIKNMIGDIKSQQNDWKISLNSPPTRTEQNTKKNYEMENERKDKKD